MKFSYALILNAQKTYVFLSQAGILFITRVYNFFAFLIFWILATPCCSSCKQYIYSKKILCDLCRKKIAPIVSTDVQITATKYCKVFAVADYQEPLKSLILSKGFSNIAACRELGVIIWQMIPVAQVPYDCIVPVPLHWLRYAKRGYNQAHEIAKILAELSGKPIDNILKRNRNTVFQSALTHDKRADNLNGAMSLRIKKCKEQNYTGKHILLVDDLFTTGATVREAAKVLYQLKPASITIVVACRVI